MGKGGRKRRAGKREPSGKLSRRVVDKQARRTIDEQSAMQVAKEARQRVFGISEADSATELAGSIVGRLLLQGAISREHFDAAVAFQATYAGFLRAIDAPPSSPKAISIGAPSGPSPADMSRAQAETAKKHWRDACMALSVANIPYPENVLFLACDRIALREEYQPHLHGDLRLGLNALARHFGLLARVAA